MRSRLEAEMMAHQLLDIQMCIRLALVAYIGKVSY